MKMTKVNVDNNQKILIVISRLRWRLSTMEATTFKKRTEMKKFPMKFLIIEKLNISECGELTRQRGKDPVH